MARRRLISALALPVAAAALAAAPLSAPSGRADAERTAAARLLLGLRGAPDGSFATLLARLDPLTLEPRGRALRIGEFHAGPVFSPDRRSLAVGLSESPPPGFEPAGRVGLWIVDRASLEIRHRVATGIAVEAAAWPTRERIIAYVQSYGIAVIDARTGQVLSRHRIRTPRCCALPMVELARGAAVVTPRLGRPGVLLSLVAAGGEVRRVVLRRLRVETRESRSGSPGLARAPRGRVLASAPNRPLAVVDVRTGAKRYLPLPRAPSCAGTDTCHDSRQLIWLGDERVAVHDRVVARREGKAGVRGRTWLVDLRDGHARRISRQPYLTQTNGALVAFGRGLTLMGREGRPRLSALPRHRLWNVQVKRGRIYAVTDERRPRVSVLDARSGRTLNWERPFRGHFFLM